MRMTHARSAKPHRCPDMRFVRVKSEEQQAALTQHTSWQREGRGIENLGELVRMLDEDDEDLAPIPASALRAVDAHVPTIDEQIEAWQRESASVQALKTIPGVGALISGLSPRMFLVQ